MKSGGWGGVKGVMGGGGEYKSINLLDSNDVKQITNQQLATILSLRGVGTTWKNGTHQIVVGEL